MKVLLFCQRQLCFSISLLRKGISEAPLLIVSKVVNTLNLGIAVSTWKIIPLFRQLLSTGCFYFCDVHHENYGQVAYSLNLTFPKYSVFEFRVMFSSSPSL